jgi:hypothetical protein
MLMACTNHNLDGTLEYGVLGYVDTYVHTRVSNMVDIFHSTCTYFRYPFFLAVQNTLINRF